MQNQINTLKEYMGQQEFKQTVEKIAIQATQSYLRSQAFTDKKVTDTPTDALAVVNRKFVTMNGTVANRPTSSIATIGQNYYATDTGIPMTYSVQGWKNGVGSVVAQG